MEAIICKKIGKMGVEMVADLDWGIVKRLACDKWGIEEAFDKGRAWDALRKGKTVIYLNDIYTWYSEAQHGGHFVADFDGAFWDLVEAVNVPPEYLD